MLLLHPDIIKKLNKFIETGNIPHIIFHGPNGNGKHAILNYFISKIYSKHQIEEYVMYINCSHNKGIKFIREDLKFFSKLNINKKKNIFKSIVLFNADKLTIDAQSALRRCIETFSHSTRFFIVINNTDKILKPIFSRFCNIYIPLPTIENKKTNLHLHQKTQINPHIHKNICHRQLQFKNLVNNINVKNLDDCIIYANKIYNKGFSCNDFINYLDNLTHTINNNSEKDKYLHLTYFSMIKREFRNEKILLIYVLYFTYLRKKLTLENIVSM